MNQKIAVILPAFNEELTVSATVRAFHAELPDAEIWVVNNNSSDKTACIASETIALLGAKGGVITESNQGKGHALRKAFHMVNADFYVLSDADTTYPAEQVHDLLNPLRAGAADMVVGNRHEDDRYKKENKRPLHNFGNILVRTLVNLLFGAQLRDVMSGYRAFTRRFVKHYPILVAGFQVETDMTLHALDKRFALLEVPIKYKDRPEGSFSKLRTLEDGIAVLATIANILRHYRPLLFFTGLALATALCGFLAGFSVIADFLQDGLIERIPLAILATGLELVAVVLFVAGLILDSILYQERLRFERELLLFGNANADDR